MSQSVAIVRWHQSAESVGKANSKAETEVFRTVQGAVQNHTGLIRAGHSKLSESVFEHFPRVSPETLSGSDYGGYAFVQSRTGERRRVRDRRYCESKSHTREANRIFSAMEGIFIARFDMGASLSIQERQGCANKMEETRRRGS